MTQCLSLSASCWSKATHKQHHQAVVLHHISLWRVQLWSQKNVCYQWEQRRPQSVLSNQKVCAAAFCQGHTPLSMYKQCMGNLMLKTYTEFNIQNLFGEVWHVDAALFSVSYRKQVISVVVANQNQTEPLESMCKQFKMHNWWPPLCWLIINHHRGHM